MTRYAVSVGGKVISLMGNKQAQLSWAKMLRRQGYKNVKVFAEKKSNPGRKTKAQKTAAASRKRKQNGLVKAVKNLLKKSNPSAKITGARLVKLKGGALRITPIKANKGRR